MNRVLHSASVLFALVLLAACEAKPPGSFPGYAEGEYVRLAAPIGGTLTKLYLNRGDTATAAAPAFELEHAVERSAQEEASSRVARSQDQLLNLRQGRRPDEMAALRAQLAQAQAALDLSTAEQQRTDLLVKQKFLSAASLDQARAAVARDQGHLNNLSAQLRQAAQGARAPEISAAAQDVKAAQAQLEQAQWRIDQKTQRTPIAGDVVDVMYREGEWVPAGAPVITLLPGANLKARFFLPQALLGGIAIGQAVSLMCDGCGAPIPATISFISREAEYTSPIIYSKENRASLVFMVEARPGLADARRLHPGQPLEAHLTNAVARP
jgi:HlyD family secretion protein